MCKGFQIGVERMREIGELEAEILEITRAKQRVSAREVFRIMYQKRDIAYTTVSTTLERLTKKHLLTRDEQKIRGKVTYFYRPSKSGVEVSIASKSIARLVKAFGPGVVSAAFSGLSVTPDEFRKLEEKVREAKKSLANA